jgi:hypothetical protein
MSKNRFVEKCLNFVVVKTEKSIIFNKFLYELYKKNH